MWPPQALLHPPCPHPRYRQSHSRCGGLPAPRERRAWALALPVPPPPLGGPFLVSSSSRHGCLYLSLPSAGRTCWFQLVHTGEYLSLFPLLGHLVVPAARCRQPRVNTLNAVPRKRGSCTETLVIMGSGGEGLIFQAAKISQKEHSQGPRGLYPGDPMLVC